MHVHAFPPGFSHLRTSAKTLCSAYGVTALVLRICCSFVRSFLHSLSSPLHCSKKCSFRVNRIQIQNLQFLEASRPHVLPGFFPRHTRHSASPQPLDLASQSDKVRSAQCTHVHHWLMPVCASFVARISSHSDFRASRLLQFFPQILCAPRVLLLCVVVVFCFVCLRSDCIVS